MVDVIRDYRVGQKSFIVETDFILVLLFVIVLFFIRTTVNQLWPQGGFQEPMTFELGI